MHQPAELPWNGDFDFAAFRQQVAQFQELLRTAPSRDPRAFKWGLIAHLAGLYASGTQMPPYSPFMPDDPEDEQVTSHEPSAEQVAARRVRLQALANSLWAVIGEEDDAYFAVDVPDEETVSQYSLSRELVFILAGLEKGAAAWDAGRYDDAAWTWTIGFEEGGWGEEILSVLACLHYVALERMSLPQDSPNPLPKADPAVDPEE